MLTRTLIVTALCLCGQAALCAGQEAPSSPPPPATAAAPTTTTASPPAAVLELAADRPPGQDYIVLRADVELAQPGQWHGVRFRLNRPDGTPLADAAGRPWMGDWGQIFTPTEPAAATYRDLRLAVTLAELGACLLGPDRRTVLQLVCDVRRLGEGGGIISGPPQPGCWLVLTRDDKGAITDVQALTVDRPLPWKPAGDQADMTRLRLDVRHLVPRPGVEFFRYDSPPAAKPLHYRVARLEGMQVVLGPASVGAAFERIDSPDKARELAMLSFGSSMVVKSASAAGKLLSAPAATTATAPAAAPADTATTAATTQPDLPDGVEAVELPQIGYRVRAVMLDGTLDAPGGLWLRQFVVAADGRIGMTASDLWQAGRHDPAALRAAAARLTPDDVQPASAALAPTTQPTALPTTQPTTAATAPRPGVQ